MEFSVKVNVDADEAIAQNMLKALKGANSWWKRPP